MKQEIRMQMSSQGNPQTYRDLSFCGISIGNEIEKRLSSLTNDELRVFEGRLCPEKGRVKTLAELANELGNSKSEVRRVEERALKKFVNPHK